jgi:hypothetical protein
MMEAKIKAVFNIIDDGGSGSEKKSRWIRIGTGFINKDNSLNILLDLIPLNGKLHVRDLGTKNENP